MLGKVLPLIVRESTCISFIEMLLYFSYNSSPHKGLYAAFLDPSKAVLPIPNLCVAILQTDEAKRFFD